MFYLSFLALHCHSERFIVILSAAKNLLYYIPYTFPAIGASFSPQRSAI